jgi:hypothetical protein
MGGYRNAHEGPRGGSGERRAPLESTFEIDGDCRARPSRGRSGDAALCRKARTGEKEILSKVDGNARAE